MIVHRKVSSRRHRGKGLVNKIIKSLPFELHLPTYQYCGPHIKVAKRLVRGDSGINPLDVACKDQDIAYSRNREDDASALAVTNIMNAKAKLDLGLQKNYFREKKPLAK